jgi:hypothetical protein
MLNIVHKKEKNLKNLPLKVYAQKTSTKNAAKEFHLYAGCCGGVPDS